MKNIPLKSVQKATFNFMQEYSPELGLEEQLKGHQLLSSLQLLKVACFELPALQDRKSKIAQRTIDTALDSSGLRMSLYYMPKGLSMPTHNHPEMMVLSYIIEGHLQAKLYTPTNQQMTFTRQLVDLRSHSLSCIDGLRTMDRNLHELNALQNTVFMDIIFPDYDDKQRDCLCFEEAQSLHNNLCILRQVPCSFDIEAL